MRLSEHIRDAQKLLEKHGDLEFAIEFTELYTNQVWLAREGISPIALATLKDGTQVACIDAEVNEMEDEDEDEDEDDEDTP